MTSGRRALREEFAPELTPELIQEQMEVREELASSC